MGTNATTWFYNDAERGRPYLIAERLNQTFWNNRITGILFTCVNAEPPYRLVGMWNNDVEVEIEYEVGTVFILRMSKESVPFVRGCREILGFDPTVSYTDPDGRVVTEWYAKDADKRLREVQGNPSFHNVKRFKRN